MGGVVCGLASFDGGLEFEPELGCVSFVLESLFEPKAVINDRTVEDARDIHDQPNGYGKRKETCETHGFFLHDRLRRRE